MEYSIKATPDGCIETIKLPNGEIYTKRSVRTANGCRRLDPEFAEQMERNGICEEVLDRIHDCYDDFVALDFLEINELVSENQ